MMSKCYKKVKRFSLGSAFLISLLATPICSAGDINAGKAKAQACVSCHGPKGISTMPNYPNLAGQKEQYLAAAINSYRSGKRSDPTMNAMVAALTDADAENIAAYFSSLTGK